MKLTDAYYKARTEAIKWLNGKRDFKRGTKLLMDSGYKPHVAAKIAKWGPTSHAIEKLEHEIRMMIQLWSDPEAPEHEDESETSENEGLLAFIGQTESEGEEDSLKKARILCGQKFRDRGVLRNQLIEIGESNDEKSVESRKELIEQIKALSVEIDEIYQEVKKGEPEDLQTGKQEGPGEEEPSREALNKVKGNIKSKLTRARCMLEYQQEKKGKTPNPMPEGPKRLSYENKISRLESDLKEIEFQLAAFA